MKGVLEAWLALGLFSAMAFGQSSLTVALSPSVQNSGPGEEIVFSGTLTNTSSTAELFLNGVQITGQAAPLSLQANTFFFNVPGILPASGSYTGPLFSVLLAAGAASADYPATISFLGGSNSSASTSLATAGFTVLSPTASIAATAPDASEYGPVSGTFTFSRTGGTGADLPIVYTTSGTAGNGVTYVALSGNLTIPSGSSTATLSLTPIPDDLAEGDRYVTLSVSANTAYTVGDPASATVTVQDKPADEWRFEVFGAAANSPAASDTGEWNGDGIPNLIEYALNLDPLVSEANALPAPAALNGYLTLSYVPNPAAVDVAYVVEGSTDLINWSASNAQAVAIGNPQPPNSVTYEFIQPISAASRAFLRLRVNRLSQP